MDAEQCKLLKNNDFPDVNSIDFRKLANRGEKFLTEDGVYEMIFQSRKSEAKVFRKWVTSEVLPSINKHGAYITKDTMLEMARDPNFTIALLQELESERTAKEFLAQENAKETQ